jgi:hypothetical protein
METKKSHEQKASKKPQSEQPINQLKAANQ